jgi:DNA invertase Pin-like site-specific DNA recombinase
MNARKRAMIYARVATQKQLKDHGLPTQVEACRRYANQQGLTVAVDQVITDPCYSGLTLNRPGLDRVRALTEARKADVVLVSEMNQLSRDTDQLPLLYQEWQRIGIKVYCMSR